MTSSAIVPLMNEPLSSLIGKDAVRSYWAKASELIPDLHFELVTTLVGVNSITLYYQGPLGMSTECLQFGTDQKVHRVFAHYAA